VHWSFLQNVLVCVCVYDKLKYFCNAWRVELIFVMPTILVYYILRYATFVNMHNWARNHTDLFNIFIIFSTRNQVVLFLQRRHTVSQACAQYGLSA
jgi:hypothetical protein